jgi:hypothetical protein
MVSVKKIVSLGRSYLRWTSTPSILEGVKGINSLATIRNKLYVRRDLGKRLVSAVLSETTYTIIFRFADEASKLNEVRKLFDNAAAEVFEMSNVEQYYPLLAESPECAWFCELLGAGPVFVLTTPNKDLYRIYVRKCIDIEETLCLDPSIKTLSLLFTKEGGALIDFRKASTTETVRALYRGLVTTESILFEINVLIAGVPNSLSLTVSTELGKSSDAVYPKKE